MRVPGVHPWFAGLAVRDVLADEGLRCGGIVQVGPHEYEAEVL